jgi:hypothetical protein
MPDGKSRAPVCAETNYTPIDSGTMCLATSETPTPVNYSSPEQGTTLLVSPAFKSTVDITFSIAPGMTWDGFWRLAYDRVNDGFNKQASLLLKEGRFTQQEVNLLVEARNRAVLEFRKPLSPFGKLYSEILKPSNQLKNLDQLLEEKGTLEAVVRSAGKTRQLVDHIGVATRVVGTAAIVVEIALTAVVIAEAPANERGRVAARQIGGATMSVAGGLGGAWAGCGTAALMVSPSLVVPVVGEIGEGAACALGGLMGGFGLGWLGRKTGEVIGDKAYDVYTDFHWK